MTNCTREVQGLCAPGGVHDKAVLTLITLTRYAAECPDAPVFAVDYDIEANTIKQFLAQHLPADVYERVFKAEMLLGELYMATRIYRGDRMPLKADEHLNRVFEAAQKHLNITPEGKRI